MLGSARETRRPLAIAALASLRIGIVAALLMGPAAAIGIATRMPGLITGPRDGFVVAVYVGALFAAGVFAASLLATLLVSSMAGRNPRRSRAFAIAAGVAITGASLAYLTLWWDASTLSAAPGAGGLLWTALALAFVAAVSLLIGHLVTVASLAVSVARGASDVATRGVPGASRRALIAATLLTFAGAVLLFTLSSRADRDAAAVPALTVVPSGLRIRLFAIDGFDPGIATRLAEAGRIPALAAALDLPHTPSLPSGRVVARATVQIDDTRDPARAWTTIATGQTADKHAVRGLETRRVLGLDGSLAAGEPSPLARALAAATDLVRLTRPSIASRDQRRVKSLWEVASGAGLRTAVVNWWATWPAPADSGTVITDRATLRLERGGELDAEIAPPALYETLRARWPELRQRAAETAKTVTASEQHSLLHRSAELDTLQLELARLATDAQTDLVCTYLPGLDLAQHGLMSGGDGATTAPSAMAARLEALDAYYVFLDKSLAPVLTPGGADTVVVLTSPGRVESGTAGLFAIQGSAANPLARDAVARPTDIMPTVLHALGVPISRELSGRPLVELFSVEFARRYPVRDVTTYGAPSAGQARRSGQPLDQEMIDRLRSLGYVK